MKYLKTFESNDVPNFYDGNKNILNTIDILTSFIEDLQQLGFETGYHSSKTPIEAYARAQGDGQRYTLVELAELISKNMDKSHNTLEWILSGTSKSINEKELEESIKEFMNKLKDFSPNCRINNLRKTIEKDSVMVWTNGQYETKDKCTGRINILMWDSNKTRYKNLFTDK